MKRTAALSLVTALALLARAEVWGQAQQLPAPVVVEPSLLRAIGDVDVIVGLADRPLAALLGPNARRAGPRISPDQQRAYGRSLVEKQNLLMARIAAAGGTELARVSRAHNALAVRIDASRVRDLTDFDGVASIRLVRDYQLALGETVPYVGAAAVHGTGTDGTGVTIAILDSGVDYTHRNFEGPGTLAAFTAAYGTSGTDSRNTMRDGLFPTAKVVDGFDFVGESWPNGPRAPDPDPIDFEGHGTHVADIAAGHSLDGTHKGVAPGAKLMAVKVCSTVSTSCSGIALLQAFDFALDPDGDFDLADAADVINLSLGTPYGQREDDLSFAASIASQLGVVVVAAAGNDADKPYVIESPSTAPEVISVAQSHVPSARNIPLVITSPPNIAGTYNNTATVDWAPVTSAVSGTIAFVGRGCPAGSITPTNPDDPYLANPAGKIALIDRGSCTISLKVDRAARAGAIAVLIGLVAPGDAVTFAFGGGSVFVPTLVITQATSNLIKANLAAGVTATFSPTVTLPLVGSVVGSSARGPGYSFDAIKPDIAAPGASISAIAGGGTAEQAFGGTSGATPMVAGAAALLLQRYPAASPQEIKARLVNSGETNVFSNPVTQPGVLAPITRIGGGELRVDRAIAIQTGVWDADDPEAIHLSFGHLRIAEAGRNKLQKKVVVRNYGTSSRTYSIVSSFRYASDATGAVTLSAPPAINVNAGGTKTFVLSMTIDPLLLPTWTLNGGSNGGNGVLLNGVEFDGYLTLSDGTDTVHVPWHVLPHKAANVRASTSVVQLANGGGSLTLTNHGGARDGRLDAFALTGSSPKLPPNTLPDEGDNFAVIDLKYVGARLVSAGAPAVQFAINTWGERSHPNYPAEFDVFIDTDRDGTPDYVVFNLENGGVGVTGQNVVAVANLRTNTAVIRFFADADLNSSNMVMTALLSDLGLAPGTQFDFEVVAFDNYFTGAATDTSGPMTFTLDHPRFVAGGVPASVAVGASSNITVSATPGGAAASPSQTGLLLMYRDAQSKLEAGAITVLP